jgi:ligand-binding sensor domain-containing protein/signal transduction histidine kinase
MSRCRWWLCIVLSGALHAGTPPYRLFTTEDGLVRNWVTRIYRDSKGFLWFCTVEGVSIFDGYHFTNFTTRDGLPSRLVNDVLETDDGNYWIATDAGVSRFHPEAAAKARFENFRLDVSDAANRVSRLLEDSAHNIWCGTDAGLYRFAASKGTAYAQPITLESTGRAPHIDDLLEDARGRLWAVGSGLYIRSPDGAIARVAEPAVPGYPPTTITQDGRGHVWVGGYGLTEFAMDPDPPMAIARYSKVAGENLIVSSLYAGGGGDIWIGAHMLIHFRPNEAPSRRFEVFPSAAELNRQYILALASDAAGNLWAGISDLGAARISGEPSELFTGADGLESRTVRGLMESRTGTLFAFSGELALNEFTGERFEPRPRRLPASVTSMGWGQGQVAVHDRDGQWWFVSGHGVLRYPSTNDARQLAHSPPRVYDQHDGLPHNIVLRLFEDSSGNIWAGTYAGVARWDRASGRWTSFGPLDPVHSIAEDHSGAIWVGFAAPRLMRIRGTRAETITEGLPAGWINALRVDGRGRLWIGSSQGGLARADEPNGPKLKLRMYTMENGLSSDHVFSLAEDRWGRIYVADGRGVDRLDPESGAIRHFTAANGLPGGETQVVYRDRKGAIWFASNFGLARYVPEPDHIRAPPQPLLRGLTIGGAGFPLSVLGEHSIQGLELGPQQNSVEIEYRPSNFEAGEHLRFQYRLGTTATPWGALADLETVHYASLAPGKYRFEVRSISENGLVSAPASLEFRLLAPVWLRTWFLSAAAIVLLAGAYGLYRYRLNHLLAMERVRIRLATDLHDDLGAGLAEIAISSELAKRRPNDSDLLDHIAGRARSLRAALGDIVWTVDPSRDCLSALVQRMRATALAMLEDEVREVRFRAPTEERTEAVELAPDLRRHLMLFFKEAVTNIARHAAATSVDIEVALNGRRLSLCLRDNGRGFDADAKVTGHGLRSMHHRATEMRADLRLASAPNRGTEVELRLLLPASMPLT